MCEMMSKGSKVALKVLIDTHVTHVERVERLCYIETRDKHILLITFLIINQFSISKKFWKVET